MMFNYYDFICCADDILDAFGINVNQIIEVCSNCQYFCYFNKKLMEYEDWYGFALSSLIVFSRTCQNKLTVIDDISNVDYLISEKPSKQIAIKYLNKYNKIKLLQ